MNRREFLRLGAFTGAAAAMSGCKLPRGFGRSGRPIALQLWSIHKIFWNAPEKYLAELKAAGYDGVEFAGYGNKSAKELKKMLADAGLKAAGTHISGMDQYRGDQLKKNLDFCAEAGIECLGNSWYDTDKKEEWIKFGEEMSKAAEFAWDNYKIPVQIHNHFQEFVKKYDGEFAWDLIWKNASPRLFQQIDTSQVIHPGCDVLGYLKKYPETHVTIHMKENVPSSDGYFGVAPDPDPKTGRVGPVVPWHDVVDYIESEENFRWYVIECERRPDSLRPAIFNLRYLKGII